MTSDTAGLFAELAALAFELDVRSLRQTIAAGRDDGLKAARYDGAGGRSAEVSSHPERQALAPKRDRTDADLALLTSHERTYVWAIAEIAVRSRSGRPCEDWDEAVKDHQLLAEMDAVGVLERIPGEKPAKWVTKAGDALHDLSRLADQHVSRAPKDWERSWTSGLSDEACCRLCLEHVNLRTEAKAKRLCQMHLRLYNEAGEVDPPEWLTQEYRRIGSPSGPDWKRARSRWLQSEGVQDRSAS